MEYRLIYHLLFASLLFLLVTVFGLSLAHDRDNESYRATKAFVGVLVGVKEIKTFWTTTTQLTLADGTTVNLAGQFGKYRLNDPVYSALGAERWDSSRPQRYCINDRCLRMTDVSSGTAEANEK